MENYYNLIDEKWIPVLEYGRISLRDVFSSDCYENIDGNPIQQISLLKLFFAIAQASTSLKAERDVRELGTKGLSDRCLKYLDDHYGDFYLYGSKPFLQMPALRGLEKSVIQPLYFDYQPDLASENDTILKESQKGKMLTDAEKAVFIISLMNYAPGGKRVSNTPALSLGYKKSSSAKAGPSLGAWHGYLMSMIRGKSIRETVFLNFFPDDVLEKIQSGLSEYKTAPWEVMPKGEDDEIARNIKKSVFAWYVSVCRFVLLDEDGIRYSEGLIYSGKVKNGWYEPHISINKKDLTTKYCDVFKAPWREFESLIAVVFNSAENSFECSAIKFFIDRARELTDSFSIWSGGLQIRDVAGDQSVKQEDDYVESYVELESELFDDDFYLHLVNEMAFINERSECLRFHITGYNKAFSSNSKNVQKAMYDYWWICGNLFNRIVKHCQCQELDSLNSVNDTINESVIKIYDSYCPRDTVRQLTEWVKNRPSNGVCK